jgi:hypothetical protein
MIKNFSQFVTEKKATYDFGCAMLYADFPKMQALHEEIENGDVYVNPEDSTFGLETEPHVTLLYGLHEEVSIEQVQEALGPHKFGPIVAYNASLFQNEKYDVLKFDIRYPVKGGAFLHKCNRDLAQLPHTTNFPDYHPHMTVAYIKKGFGQKYADKLNGQEYQLDPTHAIYSMPNGEKHRIEINK